MKTYRVRLLVFATAAGLIFLLNQGNLEAQEEVTEEEKVEEKTSSEEPKPAKKVKKDLMFHLEPFIVNLAKSGGNRFLKVTVSLEMSSPEVRPGLKKNIQKVTDSILLLLSTKTFKDVYSVQGKFTLKGEITTRVNQFLTEGQVKGAYFTEFIIQ
ncbi:flagellar basal body-associated FliL family protein [Nitrospinaceae bacterium]|nr:flagellar basal body-associated FliL family protein [Nitrospinaceae bacterium]